MSGATKQRNGQGTVLGATAPAASEFATRDDKTDSLAERIFIAFCSTPMAQSLNRDATIQRAFEYAEAFQDELEKRGQQ